MKRITLIRRSLRPLAFFLPLATLVGCQTTGNPRQGGLLGWSEDKADIYMTDCFGQEQQAREAAAREASRMRNLTDQRDSLARQVESLQQDLTSLDHLVSGLGTESAQAPFVSGARRRLSSLQAAASDLASGSEDLSDRRARVTALEADVRLLRDQIQGLIAMQ